ncbi:MAG TPA: YciI family protein [Verrucomicrobiae bacterium]|nr:YciI family protein [Verrucomicrobiae bacterium]
MRFMVIVKAGKDCEAGKLPSKEKLATMGKFNQELTNAGVLLALEGLAPSSKGARVKFAGKTRTVTDGPFAESKELVGGFWLWKCKSKQEAVEWLKRAPFEDGEVEIRQVHEPEDFAERFTHELGEQQERIRAAVEAHA